MDYVSDGHPCTDGARGVRAQPGPRGDAKHPHAPARSWSESLSPGCLESILRKERCKPRALGEATRRPVTTSSLGHLQPAGSPTTSLEAFGPSEAFGCIRSGRCSALEAFLRRTGSDVRRTDDRQVCLCCGLAGFVALMEVSSEAALERLDREVIGELRAH